MNISYEIQKTLDTGNVLSTKRKYYNKKGGAVNIKTADYFGNKVTVFKSSAQVCTDGCGDLKSFYHQYSTSLSPKINAEEIPYIVYPDPNDLPGSIGDLGVILNTNTGQYTYVIDGERGPENKLGEISYKAHTNIRNDDVHLRSYNGEDWEDVYRKIDVNSGIDNDDVIYILFNGTGKKYGFAIAEGDDEGKVTGKVPTPEFIQEKGALEFENFIKCRNLYEAGVRQ